MLTEDGILAESEAMLILQVGEVPRLVLAMSIQEAIGDRDIQYARSLLALRRGGWMEVGLAEIARATTACQAHDDMMSR